MAAPKGTTIKEALSRFEEKYGQKAAESKEVKLYMQVPPIEKMDASLSTLAVCEHLALSTNAIEKIANLNGLKHLKILSLARNNIKSLNGLEAVSDTLEELWFSNNLVEKLKGIQVLKKLKVLYLANNSVKEYSELFKLGDLPMLVEFRFSGNPLEVGHKETGTMEVYRDKVTTKLSKLKKLDGEPVLRDEEEDED